MTIWALPLATTELSPRSLTSKILTLGIRSLIDRSDFRPVTIIQCSTPKRNSCRQS